MTRFPQGIYMDDELHADYKHALEPRPDLPECPRVERPNESLQSRTFMFDQGRIDGHCDAKLGRPMSVALRFFEGEWWRCNSERVSEYERGYRKSYRETTEAILKGQHDDQ